MIADLSPQLSSGATPYVVTIICLVCALLFLLICATSVTVISVRARIMNQKECNLEQQNEEETSVYDRLESIQFQQINQAIHTSKNVAYSHVSKVHHVEVDCSD